MKFSKGGGVIAYNPPPLSNLHARRPPMPRPGPAASPASLRTKNPNWAEGTAARARRRMPRHYTRRGGMAELAARPPRPRSLRPQHSHRCPIIMRLENDWLDPPRVRCGVHFFDGKMNRLGEEWTTSQRRPHIRRRGVPNNGKRSQKQGRLSYQAGERGRARVP